MRHFQETWNRNSWLVAGLLGVFGFIFALIGFLPTTAICQDKALVCASDVLFKTFQMFVLNYGDPIESLWLHSARLMLPAALSIAVIQGLLATAHRRGGSLMVRLFWSDHVVICGGSVQARLLAREHMKPGRTDRVVLIHLGDKHQVEVDELAVEGIVVLTEDASREDALLRLGLHRARVVYVIAGDDQANLRIFESITAFMRAKGKRNSPLVCLLHCYNRVLGQRVLDEYLRKNTSEENCTQIDIRPFNTWMESARNLYRQLGPDTFFPVSCETDPQPHAIIIGRTWFSEQLVDQGAFLGHYLHDRKLRITLLGTGSDDWRNEVTNLYPALHNQPTGSIWQPEESRLIPVIDLNSEESKNYIDFICGIPKNQNAIIYLCMDNISDALALAHALEAHTRSNHTPIVICSPEAESSNFNLRFLNSEVESTFQDGRIFGYSSTLNGIKIDVHESFYRAELDTQALKLHNSFCGRGHDESWLNEDYEWSRESSRQAVSHLPIKAKAVGWKTPTMGTETFMDKVSDHQRELLSKMEHQRWCAERLMFGWRFSAEKKPIYYLHNNLVEYEKLLPTDKNKDKAIVSALAVLNKNNSTFKLSQRNEIDDAISKGIK